jgi:hypothetical protein
LPSRNGDLGSDPKVQPTLTSLYDAVAHDLRPAVLHLAMAAAARRQKKDVPVRFADWIGRPELAEWYQATGMPGAAAMVRARPAITDPDTFRHYWPTSVHASEWRTSLDDLIGSLAADAGRASRRGRLPGGEQRHRREQHPDRRVPREAAPGSRRHRERAARRDPDSRQGRPVGPGGLYLDPMWAFTRPAVRQMAEAACEIAGWDPATPAPPDSHPLMEFGYPACAHAARVAVAPLEHASLVREMRAFRRIAYGQPLDV